MGSGGTVEDLTGHPPYPPGFEVKLKAVPEDPEKHAFTHWGIENPGTALQAEDFFSNPESPITWFRVPDYIVRIFAYFTTRGEWTEPNEFDYDHNNFGQRIEGRYGVHYDFWDVSNVETGRVIDFYFHALGIPDRFRVYYGDERLFDEEYFMNNKTSYQLFNSHWVSVYPERHINPMLYSPLPMHHDWHVAVEESDWRLFGGLPGGKYQSLVEKEEGKDVLIIEVEGRDSGTVWNYKVEMEERFLSLPFKDDNVWVGWIFDPQKPSYPGSHWGIDFQLGPEFPESEWQTFEVVAAAAGEAYRCDQSIQGNRVIIKHNIKDAQQNNYYTRYIHLYPNTIHPEIPYRSEVAAGRKTPYKIERGEKIGMAGDTGSEGLIHLHFEVLSGGDTQDYGVDPFDLYTPRDDPWNPRHWMSKYFTKAVEVQGGPNYLWTHNPPRIYE